MRCQWICTPQRPNDRIPNHLLGKGSAPFDPHLGCTAPRLQNVIALSGLFVAAFLAASPLPFQSEIVFAGLVAAGSENVWLLVLVASIGNTLGSCVTYGIARSVAGYSDSRLALPAAKRIRVEAWFARWGVWVLLLSWAPGGDLIVAIAGVLRTPIWLFLTLVAFAKTGRYIAVLAMVSAIGG